MSLTGFAATTIDYSYQFCDPVKKTFRKKGIGESVYGKMFSPAPGYLFQLKIFNVDSAKFAVYLKNCGEDDVHILEYKIHLPEQRWCSSKRECNFNLRPQACKALTGFAFKNLGDQKGNPRSVLTTTSVTSFMDDPCTTYSDHSLKTIFDPINQTTTLNLG